MTFRFLYAINSAKPSGKGAYTYPIQGVTWSHDQVVHGNAKPKNSGGICSRKSAQSVTTP